MIVNKKLNIKVTTLTKIGLAKNTSNTTKITEKRAYLSMNSAHFCHRILMSLYPSNGAIGIRLKIASAILRKLKFIQKLIIRSILLRKISFNVPPIIFT
jgi:hypothetical protein